MSRAFRLRQEGNHREAKANGFHADRLGAVMWISPRIAFPCCAPVQHILSNPREPYSRTCGRHSYGNGNHALLGNSPTACLPPGDGTASFNHVTIKLITIIRSHGTIARSSGVRDARYRVVLTLTSPDANHRGQLSDAWRLEGRKVLAHGGV